METNAAVRAHAGDDAITRTQRRCINRSCGRFRSKVEFRRCHSCGRSTRWAPTAFLFVLAKSFR